MNARIRVGCLMLEQLEIRSLLTGFLTPGGTDPIAIPAAVGAAVFSYPDPTAPLGSPTNPIYGGLVNGGAVTPTPGGTDPIAIPDVVGATAGAGQASGGAGLVLRTPAARYVDQLFVTFLDRAPTQSDLTFWTGVVRRDGARSAAREIADSPEARMHGAPGSATNPIYIGVINGGEPFPRSGGSDPITIPEVVGATGGVGQASGGAGLVLDTPAARYVDQLFVTFLDRAPTQSDLTFWTGVVRRYAAREIVNSPEAKLHGA
jgi:hypothetical protein